MARQPSPTAVTANRNPVGRWGLGGYRASDLRSRTIEDVSRGTFRWFANRIPRLPPRAETRWVVRTHGCPASASSTHHGRCFAWNLHMARPTDFRSCYRELEPRLVVGGCGCPASASAAASSKMFHVEHLGAYHEHWSPWWRTRIPPDPVRPSTPRLAAPCLERRNVVQDGMSSVAHPPVAGVKPPPSHQACRLPPCEIRRRS
jgi:hypothetical protein